MFLGPQVTKDAFESTLSDIASTCEPDDLVVITWSGHGKNFTLVNGRNSGFLVPFDAPGELTLKTMRQFISMRDVTLALDELIRARHVVLLLDCCCSGMIMSSRGGGPTEHASQKRMSDLLEMRCRYAIAAGRADEEVADEGRSTGTSPFVEALLNWNEDDNNKYCDVEKLKIHIGEHVADVDSVSQTPTGGSLPGHENGVAFLNLPSTGDRYRDVVKYTVRDRFQGLRRSGGEQNNGVTPTTPSDVVILAEVVPEAPEFQAYNGNKNVPNTTEAGELTSEQHSVLAKCVEMGFDAARAKQVLVGVNWDIHQATTQLTGGGSSGERKESTSTSAPHYKKVSPIFIFAFHILVCV